MFLRGTKTLVAILFSSLAALILLVWACLGIVFPFVRRILAVRRSRRPYKRFMHESRILRKRLGEGDEGYFYFLLSKAFRAVRSGTSAGRTLCRMSAP